MVTFDKTTMKRLVLFVFFASLGFSSRASHIIGGDIYYDYLGNNQYRFFITLYRDCASNGAAYDNPLQLAIYLGNGTLFQNVSIPFPGSTPVPVVFNNPCATPPGGICVEKATYTVVVTLAPNPLGYDVSYQRCCRGPNVTNLINPDDTGITLTTHIPGTSMGNGTLYQNSSPRFTNYPPILLCNLESKIINQSATDPDGDVLTYSLVTPNAGASSITPVPSQTPAPPYPPVTWAPGFNATNPLGPGSTISINQNTGIMQVLPVNVGLFVVGIKVTETRNGVVIGSTVRDFLFRIFNCNITLQALLPTQEQLPTFVSYCQGLTVNFVNNSYGGSTYAWDFGVPGINNDVSSAFQPTYTYPSPGTYTASLIVNPGQACSDTAYMTLTVNNPFSVSWNSNDSLCIIGNSFNFIGISSAPPGTGTYNWSFGTGASIASATGLNVSNVSFNAAGFHPVTITGNDGACVTSFTDSVFLFDVPVAHASVPANLNCIGLTVPFGNTSTNSMVTHWDFGVLGNTSDTSDLVTPTYTYPSPGTYTVTLSVSSGSNCNDSDTLSITLNEPLQLSFTHNDSLCINGGLYSFDATVSGPPNATFWWDFGPHGNPANSTLIDVAGVTFLHPGIQPITLYGAFDNCMDSVRSNVYVYAEPTIGFTMIQGLQCVPYSATFINTSTSDGPAQYHWDFGDGSASNGFNGFHTYYQVGNYSVSLTLTTAVGCVDTLYLMQQDIINVHPSPTAMFSVNPQEVNVCENKVTFTNESLGASTYLYVVDHNSCMETAPNFVHEYAIVGTDYPQLVVTNAFGCKDSVRKTLLVLPFAIYVPNTFIPDEDGKNDLFLPICPFEIYDWDFQIYNRWGQMVFITDQLSEGWKGTFEGMDSPDGVYTYKIRYRGCEYPSAWQQITGSVRLLR
jgi:gliding motility-associated-like protein